MTTTADATAAPPRRIWLRILLAVVAAVETLNALSDISTIFIDYGHTTPLLIFAQWLIKARVAVAPLIAGAAFVLALMGRLRHAIVTLAALVLVTWLTELPSIAIHGLELSADYGGLLIFTQRFVYPVIAIAAVILALRNTRLALAGVLVSLPTIIAWAGVLIFAIAIAIYGF